MNTKTHRLTDGDKMLIKCVWIRALFSCQAIPFFVEVVFNLQNRKIQIQAKN